MQRSTIALQQGGEMCNEGTYAGWRVVAGTGPVEKLGERIEQ
jgi:hypothetical protein